MRFRHLAAMAVVLCSAGRPGVAFAQKTVVATVPLGVSFAVTDVSRSVTATPAPFRVIFTTAGLAKSDKVGISVKAESANFTGPGTTMIPASKVSWTAIAVGGGSGSAGTLSSAAYTQVYQSSANVKSGEVDVTWNLASIAASGLRSGTHSLTVRWRFEVF